MMESVWRQETDLPSFESLKGDGKTDVLIVGGGLAGLLCAWQLTQAGVDCMLIEADRICSGVTGNTTAKITSQHGLLYGKLLNRFGPEKARAYWESNQEALKEYRKICGKWDCGFEETDSYLFSRKNPQKLEGELKALDRLGIPAEYDEKLSLPFETAGGIRFAKQAQFHPLKFAASLADGLKIYEKTKAREWVGNTVITDRGKIQASKVIVATHFPVLNKHGGYFLKMYQQRSYVLGLENAPKVNGMYLEVDESGLSLRTAGEYLLLGGGGHRTGKQGGGWRELEAVCRSCMPDAREAFRWAAQDCMTLDGIPYIGQYGKTTENLYVITGFNKWGMTSAMVGAMLLRDRILEKENPFAELFSPDRSSLHPQLIKNIAESSWNLLTPTKPRCPHLGCALKWNSQERSWDCPCHGSRFSREGMLLDNPAEGDLP